MFNAIATERLRYYVYALFDSESDSMPFYIGKGCGNRVFDHVNQQIQEWDESDETQLLSAKLAIIAAIKEAGRRVVHRIVRYDMCEEEALHVEAALIDMVNLMHPGLLVNEILGHGVAQGIIDTDDLRTMLNAQPLQTDKPLLLVKIERRWSELLKVYGAGTEIPREMLYEAARGDWRLNKHRADRVNGVLVIARGIVREVFANELWEPAPDKPRRIRMSGNGTLDATHLAHFNHCSVAHYFSTGSQSPVKYINDSPEL